MNKGYLGKYSRKVDFKNKISIPKVFLDKLDGNRDIILGEFKGFDDNILAVFPSREVFDEKVNTYMELELQLEDIYYKRLISSYCFSETIDSVGRISLKNHIVIPSDRKLVFVGRDELFEIWHEEDYDKYIENGGPKLIR